MESRNASIKNVKNIQALVLWNILSLPKNLYGKIYKQAIQQANESATGCFRHLILGIITKILYLIFKK